jgi:hypothetical protein
MGKSFAKLDFEGNFVEQIETGTGAVRSPEPFVMATLTVSILRTQGLSAAWLAQAQDDGYIGLVNAHGDSSVFPVVSLNETVIRHIDPGAYDGTDPIVRLVLRGTFYVNGAMWQAF